MDIIREQINTRGFKQKFVAEEVLGISEQNLCNKLSGRSRFTERQRARLAAFLGIPVEELFPEAAEAAVGATS